VSSPSRPKFHLLTCGGRGGSPRDLEKITFFVRFFVSVHTILMKTDGHRR
jgi:hypothetical protein